MLMVAGHWGYDNTILHYTSVLPKKSQLLINSFMNYCQIRLL
jgi:hypothetical protein